MTAPLPDTAAEAMADAIKAEIDRQIDESGVVDPQTITQAAWAASPGPRLLQALNMMAHADVDLPEGRWFRDLARAALATFKGEGG